MSTHPATTPTPKIPLPSPHNWLNNYRLYADPEVTEEILDFHARSCFVFPRKFPSTFFSKVPEEVLARTEWSETSLYPEPINAIDIPKAEPLPLRRISSPESLSGQIAAKTLMAFLANAFCNHPDCEPHRPIPSAGALFPVEIFLLNFQQVDSWLAPGIYHLLPASRKLQPIPGNADSSVFSSSDFGNAPASLAYVLNLPKSIFKYRHRGYRHGLMEVGSLYQQAALTARHYGLGTRSWSGFCDDAVKKSLALNPTDFLPILIQVLGPMPC